MMADAKHLLEFLEGGIGMLFDLDLEFLRVEFAPVSPACFRSQRAGFGGVQIPINGTPGQVKPPGGRFWSERSKKEKNPSEEFTRISFHALRPITLCPNVNMKCYSARLRNSFASDCIHDWLIGQSNVLDNKPAMQPEIFELPDVNHGEIQTPSSPFRPSQNDFTPSTIRGRRFGVFSGSAFDFASM